MGRLRVGCQPIIFGGHDAYDLSGMLRAMAEAGYEGVEIGLRGAEGEMRRLLDETGLAVVGPHTGYDRLDQLDETVRFCRDFDASLLMVSGTGDRSAGASSYSEAAAAMNDYGRRAAREGVTLCYHNHSWEFHDVFGDRCGMDILLEGLDPACVKLCVDTYWVHDGGRDVPEFLARHGARIAVLHLKDRRNDTFAEVGQGELDWPAIFELVSNLDLPWAVVEQDTTDRDPAVSIRMSRDYLREEIGI